MANSGGDVADDIFSGTSIIGPGEEGIGTDIQRVTTNSSSTSHSDSSLAEKSVDPNIVTWSIGDPDDPKNWSKARRWWITIVCSTLSLSATFSSSAPSAATEAISQQFGTSTTSATLVTSLFLCGYVAGPLIWAPLSEMVGRRSIFLVTMFSFSVLQLGNAIGTTNLATIFAIRFLAGLFAAAPLTNCGGVIADIWDPVTRGKAITLFTASTFIGPVMGPVIGNFIVSSFLGFRWVFWIMMILSSASWLLALFNLPETYAPILLTRRAQKLRKATGNPMLHSLHEKVDFSLMGVLNRTIFRPFEMLATEPILAMVTLYLSIVYGLLYAMLEAFPVIFTDTHGLTANETGLVFIGIGIGVVLGALLNLYLIRPIKELSIKWHGHPPCEIQLRGSMAAGPFLVAGIFWLGWSGAYRAVPWFVPALATIFLGISFTLLFISSQSYLIEVYLMYSASALAANTICRSAVGAAFPLFTRQMFNGMGIQWAATLLGLVSLVIAPSPFFFYKYGPRFRSGSKFAPALDLKLRATVQAEEKAAQLAPVDVSLNAEKRATVTLHDRNLQQSETNSDQSRASSQLGLLVEREQHVERLSTADVMV
ncbi:major facilitator superfamily domain-containing protein [Phakopsora pachyrhizi]|uniref:Major facilitator superfamily domain-containing protein n=1 Tax=Phakopsora pachyrhizi TaxID=170000 RepID=A0AAV0ALK2_PHAPC|nr:major facilitator superfamily domain-containing protein [Phakopsora pachyrhizi]CAH7667894.1 major facilitator superfamily domain-containing protein [Phakopsora pachyrhizi]